MRITCNPVLTILLEWQTEKFFKPLSPASFWCEKKFLPSGHCVACLLNPHLLLIPPAYASCFCADHRALWRLSSDKILW
ncbi:RH1 [Bovine atadenovirus D]|nr:RH1 [Bovine atadenovirus D]AAK13192.1 RH1 [Bovine adenovirus 4]